jgi:Carboxylesterase family
MSANSSDLRAAMNAAMAIELFPFRPVLDGPQGIIRDSPARRLSRGAGKQVPFMAGTVLDEGLFLLCRQPRANNNDRNELHSPGRSGPRYRNLVERQLYAISVWF